MCEPGSLPADWSAHLELYREILELGTDLAADHDYSERTWERYPGW
jgi:hypothetical protein